MKTVKAKLKGTDVTFEGSICDGYFYVSCDHNDFYRLNLDEIEICKDSLQVQETCKENPDSFTGLEEAAEEYFNKTYSHGSMDIKNDVTRDFISGAEWMRKKDVEDMYLSDNSHFLKCYEQGKVDMRVQMMKEAVEAEAEVCKLTERAWITPTDGKRFHQDVYDNFKAGDKVKIIIVKQ